MSIEQQEQAERDLAFLTKLGMRLIPRALCVNCNEISDNPPGDVCSLCENEDLKQNDQAYYEYQQRRNTYYPDRPELSHEDFQKLKRTWDSNYKNLWNALNKYLEEHGLHLDFQACPQWKRIVELEREMCI